MQDVGLSVAVLAGSGGMLGWGIADFLAKKTIDRLGDVATLFWCQALGVLPLAFVFLLDPTVPSLSTFDLAAIPILGIWSGLSYIPTYVAFGKGKVSLLSPIFATYAVAVAILSAVLLGEDIPFRRQVVFAIVFSGVLLVSGDPLSLMSLVRRGERRGTSGVAGLREIFLAVGLYSLWLIAVDWQISGRPWLPFLLGIRAFSALALLAYAKATHRRLGVPDWGTFGNLSAVGLFDVAAFGSVAFGFSATSYASVVAMLSGAFSLPTILLARVFLRERATRLQTFGSLIIVLGIVLLAAMQE